ncbi:MAG: cyclic nucleotide-binding domain-containing protein [Actinomycetota bacterium]|jgi:CRP/FNR family cyclic AMP-dependent transcriptional regulator
MSSIGSGYQPAALAREFASRNAKRGPSLGRKGVALLESVPLFSGLSKRHLRRIAGLADEVSFAEGRVIVDTGSRGNAFYVIVEGTAKVLVGYSSRTLARLGPGDFFGELALLDGGPRTASVVAAEPLTAIRIQRTQFRKMLRSEPDVALKILEELAGRLRSRPAPTD